MPPLRRRRVGSAVNLSLGTLLEDRERVKREQEAADIKAEREAAKAQNEAERQAAIAKQDQREGASRRSRLYANIFKAYEEGAATYKQTIESLREASKTEEDTELKQFLSTYISNIELIKTGRDLDSKIADYNSGKLSYLELKQHLEGVKTDNEVIKARVSTNIASARTAENSRVISKAFADFQGGKTTIDSYISTLSNLRSDPTQKNPADLEKIETSLQGAQQLKTSLADRKAYSDWQTGGIGDGEAIAYFRGRQATERNPETAANVAQYLANVVQTTQKKGASSAAAFDRAINEQTSKNVKAFEDRYLDPAVESCNGDPTCVMRAYDAYGEYLEQQAAMGGSLAPYWQEQAAGAGTMGLLAASNEEKARLDAAIKDIEKDIADARVNKVLSPEFFATKQGQLAALALHGFNSQFQSDGAKKEFFDKRRAAAEDLLNFELELRKEAEKAGLIKGDEISGAYSSIFGSKKLIFTGEAGKSALEDFQAAGVQFDGSAEDQSRFQDWMQEAPGARAGQVFELINPPSVKDGKITRKTDEEKDKFISDISNAVRVEIEKSTTQQAILGTFVTVANPGITTEDKKLVLDIITTVDKGDPTRGVELRKNIPGLLLQVRHETEMMKGLRELEVRKPPLPKVQDPFERIDLTQIEAGAPITKFEQPSFAAGPSEAERAMRERREQALGLAGAPKPFAPVSTDIPEDVSRQQDIDVARGGRLRDAHDRVPIQPVQPIQAPQRARLGRAALIEQDIDVPTFDLSTVQPLDLGAIDTGGTTIPFFDDYTGPTFASRRDIGLDTELGPRLTE